MLAPSIHSHKYACMHSLQNTNRLLINSKQCKAEVSTTLPPPLPHIQVLCASPYFHVAILVQSFAIVQYIGRGWHARLHTHTHTSMHASLLLRYNNCAITVLHTEDRMKLRETTETFHYCKVNGVVTSSSILVVQHLQHWPVVRVHLQPVALGRDQDWHWTVSAQLPFGDLQGVHQICTLAVQHAACGLYCIDT